MTPSQSASQPVGPHSAAAVRRQFLEFFAARGHRIVASSPVFPQDDPTLLFTNAGMNQFKDVFLGTGKRDYTRAADSQKCIRASGKHNDLEDVGVDHYHHTFFEMLGNWSFGDYFKREAISWSWQLLTETWKLPKERLWVTVFAGDPKDGLAPDEEAERLWRECTDVDPSHILRFGRKANFWEMGETGPCGPCTEIHIDTGGPGSDPRDGANTEIGVNSASPRFLELWNNVFMEFSRQDDGALKALPARHVDTGMGLERVLRVLNGKSSNYDTDLFTPLFAATEQLCGKPYSGSPSPADIAFRVIADHTRAVTAAFADGALPSNTGRGYVLRRLIRRAARYGRQELGLERPFLHKLVPTVGEILGDHFPEMRSRAEHVALLVREEEEAFGRTLGRGLARFEELARSLGQTRRLPGAGSFELYATYGFPADLVELMAREKGLELDRAGWELAEKAHQDASRSEGQFKQLLSAEQLDGLPATLSTCHNEGAQGLALETRLARLFPAGAGARDLVVLEASPFYPEGGGQVGDSGSIRALDGSFALLVEETRKLGAVIVHLGQAEGRATPGLAVRAEVDGERRARTRKNHSATHLLHQALRQVLGTHIAQQGSYVGPERLRFDFSHPRAVTEQEFEEIERLVNAQVVANAAAETTLEELESAKAKGVMALFGEKYEQQVRVVRLGSFSAELCGGTHVRAAGDIGPFLLLSERAVQAGVRRIEALTGPGALEAIQRQRRLLQSSARALKAPAEELPERIAELQQQLKEERKKSASAAKADVGASFEKLRAALVQRAGSATLSLDCPELDGNGVRELATRVKSLHADLALALFGREQDRVPFLILCEGAALQRGLKAGDLAKIAAGLLGGGGGGRPEMAQGQGQKPEQAAAAAAAVGQRIQEVLV